MATVGVLYFIGVCRGIVLPEKHEQGNAGADEDCTGQVHDEIEQAINDVTMFRDILWEPVACEVPDVSDRADKDAYTDDRNQEEKNAPESSHNISPKNATFALVFKCCQGELGRVGI